jgi:hypothetical protein
MKWAKFLRILGLSVALAFSFEPIGKAQPKPMMHPPIITHAFAADKGHYHIGYIWKIYIEAEDPDGDMARIVSVVDQPGVGRYPPDWIVLKRQYHKHLKGYLQWNIHSTSGDLPEGTMITLRVSIVDQAGNEGNVAVFYFTFELGGKDQYKYKLPPPFDQGDIPRLGYINIDLMPPLGGRM